MVFTALTNTHCKPKQAYSVLPLLLRARWFGDRGVPPRGQGIGVLRQRKQTPAGKQRKISYTCESGSKLAHTAHSARFFARWVKLPDRDQLYQIAVGVHRLGDCD